MTRYVSLQGAFYAAPVTNGVPGAFRHLGNVADGEGSVALATETYTHKESQTGQRLEDERITTAKSATITLGLEEWSEENLALALYGDVRAAAADIVTGETLSAIAAAGDIARLAHGGVSGVTIRDSAGTPATLTEGTHYRIRSASAGLIEAIDLTGFTLPLVADYSYAASTGVPFFTAPSKELWLMFDGRDTRASANERRHTIELYRVILDPVSDLQLLHSEMGKLPLTGSVLRDATKETDPDLGQFGRIVVGG